MLTMYTYMVVYMYVCGCKFCVGMYEYMRMRLRVYVCGYEYMKVCV